MARVYAYRDGVDYSIDVMSPEGGMWQVWTTEGAERSEIEALRKTLGVPTLRRGRGKWFELAWKEVHDA